MGYSWIDLDASEDPLEDWPIEKCRRFIRLQRDAILAAHKRLDEFGIARKDRGKRIALGSRLSLMRARAAKTATNLELARADLEREKERRRDVERAV